MNININEVKKLLVNHDPVNNPVFLIHDFEGKTALNGNRIMVERKFVFPNSVKTNEDLTAFILDILRRNNHNAFAFHSLYFATNDDEKSYINFDSFKMVEVPRENK